MQKALIYMAVFPVIFLIFAGNAYTQDAKTKPDSTKIYKDLETYSKKSRLKKAIYQSIFKKTASPVKKVVKKKPSRIKKSTSYKNFEGKIIRHINIVTLDPFGYSISDTSVKAEGFISQTGNWMHIKSQNITIRNLLLIRQNQVFDSLRVRESERLVRSRGFVRDVSFEVQLSKKGSDSVDVFIREMDIWSIVPIVIISNSSLSIRLTDKNFLGLGHEYQDRVNWDHTNGDYQYSTNYFIPNIRNTYINSTLHYEYDGFNNYSRGCAVDRPFFSPLTKWASGLSVSQQFRYDSIRLPDSIFTPARFKNNAFDVWGGNAIRIFKGNSEYNRTTNFISALRFMRIHYLEKPGDNIDTLHMFSNENLYLAGFGISTRNYVQDKFIYKYGITEDVPIGKVFGIIGGYQVRNNIGRMYLSARFSWGNYYPWGYLSANFEYGTFLRSSRPEQGVFSGTIRYFTGLMETGKWKFRVFIKPEVVIGFNRFAYDSLTLNSGYGLDGFNSKGLTGISRLLLTLQVQSYSPWDFIGFRFGPYFILSMGMLGKTSSGFIDSKVYSQIGAGVLIKNENLIISTFQISFSFYPVIPGRGPNVMKINSFKSSDFGFRDFEFGKPAIVLYQ